MFTSRSSALFAAILCISGATPTVAQDKPPPRCDTTQQPQPGWYKAVAKHKTGTCPDQGFGIMKLEYANNTPPAGYVNGVHVPVKLICEQINSTYNFCEAYPQGDGLSYSWTVSNASFPNSVNPTEPSRLVRCNGQQTGSVTVTAYSPQGNGSSGSAQVSCVGAPP